MKLLYVLILCCLTCVNAQVVHQIEFNRFSHYDSDDFITYAFANHITSIESDLDYVYFGTTEGGILRYDLYKEEWDYPHTTSTGLPSNTIYDIVYDTEFNELYARTADGIGHYNRVTGFWEEGAQTMPEKRFVPYVPGQNSPFPPFSRPLIEHWPTFFPERKYQLTIDGYLYDAHNNEYNVTDRLTDSWNNLWIGTNGTGIARANLNSLQMEIIKQSIPAIIPKDVFKTGKQLWFGGATMRKNERGMARWDYRNNKWSYHKSGLEFNIFSDEIRSIHGVNNRIFFGSEQGLFAYNKKSNQWKSLRNIFELKGIGVTDLCNIGEQLFIASESGLFVYNTRAEITSELDKNVFRHRKVNALAPSDSLLFVATDFGIFEYNPGKESTTLVETRTAIADNLVEAVGVNNDTLWFAGINGIGYYNYKNSDSKSFSTTSLTLKARYNKIAFTEFYVWFATNKGLLRYDPENDYWYLYTTEDGLVDNRIYNIEVDGDYLWLSTHLGVTKFTWYRSGRFE